MTKVNSRRRRHEPIRLPAVPPGTHRATLVDQLRISWWVLKSFWHGARHGSGAARLLNAAHLVVPVALMVAAFGTAWARGHPSLVSVAVLAITTALLAAGVAAVLGRVQGPRRSLTIVDTARTATLTIVATPGEWRVTGHVAARIGSGAGRRMRAHALPHLLRAADNHQVVVTARAATRDLAEAYAAEVPALRITHRDALRGWHLRRLPKGPKNRVNFY